MRADEVKGVVDHIEEGVEILLQLKEDHHMLGGICLQHAACLTIMFKKVLALRLEGRGMTKRERDGPMSISKQLEVASFMFTLM